MLALLHVVDASATVAMRIRLRCPPPPCDAAAGGPGRVIESLLPRLLLLQRSPRWRTRMRLCCPRAPRY